MPKALQLFAFAALVWFLTTVLVEGEITRPIRDWFHQMLPHDWRPTDWHGRPTALGEMRQNYRCSRCAAEAIESIVTRTPIQVDSGPITCKSERHPKLAYLVSCHMCAGTWIGLAIGAVYPLPLHTNPIFSRLLSGLIYKAVAHLILAVNNLLERTSR